MLVSSAIKINLSDFHQEFNENNLVEKIFKKIAFYIVILKI